MVPIFMFLGFAGLTVWAVVSQVHSSEERKIRWKKEREEEIKRIADSKKKVEIRE